jgi:hypothetical protein
MTTFYKSGRGVVHTLLADPEFVDIVLIFDQDRMPCAGLFTKRGGE